MKLTATGVLAVAALAALVVGGLVLWRNWPKLKDSLNPASRENVANRGVAAAVSAATGREESLGGLIAEWFNPATRKVAELYGPSSARVKTVLIPSRDPGYSDLY